MFEIESDRFYIILAAVWVAARMIRGIMTRRFNPKREIVVNLLFVFLCMLSYRVFEPFTFKLEHSTKPNLVPIINSLRMIRTAKETGYQPIIRIVRVLLLGNLLVFVPVGMMVSLLFRKLRAGWKMLLIGMGISLLIEALQLILAVRVFDVDDIVLNALGTWLGYALFIGLNTLPSFTQLFDEIADAQRPGSGGFFAFMLFATAVPFFWLIYQAWQEAKLIADPIWNEPQGKTLLDWLRWLFFRGEG
ncbi:MAG: VanZ family protein [Chloroflexi bacterium]|nr:VanZ family protein [Chloroflexota bacterium]